MNDLIERIYKSKHKESDDLFYIIGPIFDLYFSWSMQDWFKYDEDTRQNIAIDIVIFEGLQLTDKKDNEYIKETIHKLKKQLELINE